MKMFTWIGAMSSIGLFFFDGSNIEYGIICSVMASVGYGGALVFYNSFLPEIASYDKYDNVSAKGYSFGYVGSVILLMVNLVMIQKPEWFGIPDAGLATKISFLTVGVWWIGFSQITFKYMPDGVLNRKISSKYLLNGYREIRKVWNSLVQLPDLKRYLRSFFFYNMGVQTIMYMAASFGSKALELSGPKLILTVLIINLVAIPGSYLFAKVSELKGNKYSLATMIIIWIGVSVAAYLVRTEYQFYGLAFAVGLIMGGIQSLSRATYSKLIPSNTSDHASYFSFFNVNLNVSTVIGTFAFGFIEQISGSMRNSTLFLGGFFIIGLALLYYVKIPKNIEESYKVTYDKAA